MSQSEIRAMRRRGTKDGREAASAIIDRLTALKILTAADEDAATTEAVDRLQRAARSLVTGGVSERAATQYYLAAVASCVDRFHDFQERLSGPAGARLVASLPFVH